MTMLVNSGRAVMAASIAMQAVHLAWGRGDPGWDIPLSSITDPLALQTEIERRRENINATGLIDEIGRRQVTQYLFVTPDDNGSIEVPEGRFTPTELNVESNHLFFRFNFDFEDASNSLIREIGIFVGTVPLPSCPPGQRYFTPAQLAHPGKLFAVEHIQKIERSPAMRQAFEFVITI